MKTLKTERHTYTITRNKRIRDAYEAYLKSDMYSLWDAYANGGSRAKQDAWEKYLAEINNAKVVSKCHFAFTIGGVITDASGNKFFAYVTKSKDCVMPLALGA